jgi:cytochrome c oxidase assembly protein subunit 15
MRRDATLSAQGLTDADTYARRLAGGFAGLVVLTFALITLGALVRANQAGLACPDWPLCFGEFVPQMDVRVGFEWTHRVTAGSLSLLFVGLGALTLRRESTREACGGLLALAAGLLGVQVLLGALTVWKLLASWTVTSHLLTGNAFAVVLLWISLALRDGPAAGASANTSAEGSAERSAFAPTRSSRAAVTAATGLLVLQMLLGGLVASRYAGLACPDFPSCREGLWFPSFSGAVGLQLLHRINGVALVCALMLTAVLARRGRPRLRSTALLALGLGVAQLGVGAANVLLELPPEITGLHSAFAAALVLTLSVALRDCWSTPLRA